MKAILGRLSELGLREISKLLTAAGAEGALDVDGPEGRASVIFRRGHLAASSDAHDGPATLQRATRKLSVNRPPRGGSHERHFEPEEPAR